MNTQFFVLIFLLISLAATFRAEESPAVSVRS